MESLAPGRKEPWEKKIIDKEIGIQQPHLHNVDQDEDKELHAVHPVMNEGLDNMFDELMDHYRAEQQRNSNNNNNKLTVAERVINAVIAELTLYRDKPSLPLQNADSSFSCPLKWWKSNEIKYRMISKLALCVLSIPAITVPSERVFSVAGLTIAKDWPRLAPQTANELIFQHDAIPAMRRFEESQHDGV